MKTVMDAVNEFKGEYPYGDKTHMIHWTKKTDDKALFTYASMQNELEPNSNWHSVCNQSEFNVLVFDMTVNFGESSTAQLHVWQEGIKRQPEADEQHADKLNEMNKELGVMDIDWSKAPEGATHWMPNGYEWSEAFLSISDSGKVKVFRGGAWYEASNQHSVYSLTKLGLKAKPEAQPVFTQAMADNGETVKVGMNFKTGTNLIYTAKLVNSKSVCFEDEDGFLIGITINAPKPIDTRTDTEKAIDCLDDFNLSMGNGWQEDVIGFIKSGEFHGVKWVGE